MSLLIRRGSTSYGSARSIVAKTIRRDRAQRYSCVLSYPKISNDISTSERLAPNVPPEDFLAPLADCGCQPGRNRVGNGSVIFTAKQIAWPKSAQTSPPHATVAHSIAVLPFDNLSVERENAYFADGIQGTFSQIFKDRRSKGDLRRSVMSYRGKTSNVREIGKTLGVSTVLEERSARRQSGACECGTDQRRNEQAIWAENYDRDLTDVLAIQTDLAKKIASELQAKLSPAEKERIERKPTENSEAYLAFVQARNLQSAYEDLGRLKQTSNSLSVPSSSIRVCTCALALLSVAKLGCSPV